MNNLAKYALVLSLVVAMIFGVLIGSIVTIKSAEPINQSEIIFFGNSHIYE